MKRNLLNGIIAVVMPIFLLSGCLERNTTDPIKAYKYWSATKFFPGMKPPPDIEILKAQYWESAHWTKEFILYMKLKPTDNWWNQFVEINNMVIDTGIWKKPTDAPEWFRPSNDFVMYSVNNWGRSRVFYDPQNGECYIYMIQL